MNKSELKQKLEKLNIDPRYYYLGEGPMMDCQVMMEHSYNYYSDNKKYPEWRVFFTERGDRYDENIYYTENEACNEVLKRLIKLLRLPSPT